MAVAAGITVELPLRGAGFDSTLAVTLQTVNPNRVRIWQKGVTCPFEQAGIYKIEASENGAVAKGLREDAFSFFQGRAINIAEDVFSPFYHRVASTARAVVRRDGSVRCYNGTHFSCQHARSKCECKPLV